MTGVTVPTIPPTLGMVMPPAEGVPVDGVLLSHPEVGEHSTAIHSMVVTP
jgi:hypothetical protein